MGKPDYPPDATFCRTCGYCLFGLPSHRCPECGNGFDPGDPRTFRRRPRRECPRPAVLWCAAIVVLLGIAYGGFLRWLYLGWEAERQVRETFIAFPRSILPPYVSWLLPGSCREWEQRVDEINMDGSNWNFTSEDVTAATSCRYLRALHIWCHRLTGEDLEHISQCDKLEELRLMSCGLTGEDVAPLSKLTKLRSLDLRNRELDDAPGRAAIDRLKRKLPGCHIDGP